MTKKTWLKVAGALAVTSLATMAIAADHLDGAKVKVDQTTDINDVYTWASGDKLVLAMTVFPAAAAGTKFSDKTQYIFHTTSGKTFPETAATLDIVCTFDAAQAITCLAGEGAGMPATEKVTGDASVEAGVESASKKIKVFAGLRKDAFFFNLEGFNETVKKVIATPGLVPNAAGCPAVDMTTAGILVKQLRTDKDGMAAKDFFADLNTLAIVIEIDKTVVTAGGSIVSVWGSTNTAP